MVGLKSPADVGIEIGTRVVAYINDYWKDGPGHPGVVTGGPVRVVARTYWTVTLDEPVPVASPAGEERVWLRSTTDLMVVA